MDYELHGPNLAEILINRRYITDQSALVQALEQGAKSKATHIELQLHEDEKYAADLKAILDQERLIIQRDYNTDSRSKNTVDALLVYIYQDEKIANLDVFKKYLAKFSLIFVCCDDPAMKQVRTKCERLLQDEFAGQGKQVELIHHDNVLINLTKNAHSGHYKLLDPAELLFLEQHMKLKHSQLCRIQANDPLLMYEGVPSNCVVQQSMASQTVCGEKIDYLYVIPEMNESIYLGHVLN